ncbi:MAG: trmE [Bacillales bacterium]|nr:trmE [Bacillales bacterium]
MLEFDTIAAISTAPGEGAIAIVRLSGDRAVKIANLIFKGKNLNNVHSHTVHYGHIVNPETNVVLEEVMLTVMLAPKTFTKEDVVEINCHGGIVSVNRVLELVLEYGARLAEPGEFTKRAFLNGRIDLSQAEAVIDIIRAKTDKAMTVALNQLEGRLSNKIVSLRQKLLETLAHIEVNIDYPEYDDVEEMTNSILLPKVTEVLNELEIMLQSARHGKIIREGVATAIIGRPNVGKSSLLNALIQENKAIVTDIPGTTRDVIEEYVNVRGIPLKLIDTAGIRETEDIVEKIGVERSKKAISDADLVLFVLNNNEQFSDKDLELFNLVEDKEIVIVLNKIDLPNQLNIEGLKLSSNAIIVKTSVNNDHGIEELEEAIYNKYMGGAIEGNDLTYISNTRHIDLIKKSKKSLNEAVVAIKCDTPIDLIQIDLVRAWEYLGQIIGDSVQESLIDQLFSQFCLGK